MSVCCPAHDSIDKSYEPISIMPTKHIQSKKSANTKTKPDSDLFCKT